MCPTVAWSGESHSSVVEQHLHEPVLKKGNIVCTTNVGHNNLRVVVIRWAKVLQIRTLGCTDVFYAELEDFV